MLLLPLIHYSLSCHLSAIEILNSLNHMKWIEVALSHMDTGMYLLEGKPTIFNDDASAGSKFKLEKWERLNMLSLMII